MVKDKHILFFLLACLFIAMPLLSLDAGISGDEEVHLRQAESVIKYYSSFGKDRTALHTPVTNLKYYGQSFDNLTTLLAQLFGIEDTYTFRHICNALAGWLCILFAALIAIHISGNKAAIFTVLILAASPRFLGHSYNNLKDIPFALGYVASIYFMLKIIGNLKEIKLKHFIGLILSMAFTLSIRPGGLLVFCYFVLFSMIGLNLLVKKEKAERTILLEILKNIILIIVPSYFIGLLFWPFALENPIVNPLISMKMMSDYPVILRQLFEGRVYWSDQLPWYYLLKYVSLTIPLIVMPMVVLFIIDLVKKQVTHLRLQKSILLFVIIFPFAYTIVAGSNVYGGWRHLLFTYPPLVVAASIGIAEPLSRIKNKIAHIAIIGLLLLGILPSFLFIARNHPIEYAYFNELAGDYKQVANNYELDYYYHSVREASLWLKQHIQENESSKVKITSNYGIDDYFNDCETPISFSYIPYYQRGNQDWDYGIFYRTTIAPSQTSQKLWPPAGTIHTIKTEDVPICVIVKRQTKDDYLGKQAYENKEYKKAIAFLKKATQFGPGNEIAWINLGKSYLKIKKFEKAQSAFEQCLLMIPDYEPSLYYLAFIERKAGVPLKAQNYYQQILNNNNKSYKTYLAYAELQDSMNNSKQALDLLSQCLKVNPNYKPAKELKNKIINKLKQKL